MSGLQALDIRLQKIVGGRFKRRFPLAPLTTFGIGGPADYFVEVHTEQELLRVFQAASLENLPVTLLGFGSNVLISDKGIRGVVVKLAGDFADLHLGFDGRIYAGAAVRLPKLVTFAAEHGYEGMESLVGVPGTVGGGIFMNAGTREGEIGAHIEYVRVLKTQELVYDEYHRNEIRFGYRSSSFQQIACVIVMGIFKFPIAKSKEEVLNRLAGIMKRRKETQPIDAKNVGSIFTNPKGDYAARLIEAAGLKGKQVGQAQVSPLHANFIVNLGGASCSDVEELMRIIQDKVFQKFFVRLEPEVRRLGEV